MTAYATVSSAALRSRHIDGATAFEQCRNSLLLVEQTRAHAGCLDRLGDDGFARIAFVRAKNVQIGFDSLGAGQAWAARRSAAPLAIVLVAARQGGGNRGPLGRRDQRAGKILGLDLLDGVVRIDAERVRQVRRLPPRRCPRLCTNCMIASRLPIASRTTSRKVWSAPAVMARSSARPSALSGAAAPSSSTPSVSRSRSCDLRGLVEHGEARGDVGFERKLVQQLGAERVDGLHLQPARRFQRAGEQPPRQRPPRASAPPSTARRWRRRARHRQAWSSARAYRTPASPCWRRRPW